jgi:two-component system, NarL family, nitrate/nitrite response regulator NarL
VPPAKQRDPPGGAFALTSRLRLLIADQAPMRLGIRMALEGDVDVCAEVADSHEAVGAAKREQPDVCLVGGDFTADWLGAVRGICRAAPNAAVVVLGQRQEADDLLAAVRAGAIGYVPNELNPDQLRRVIRAVAAHEAVVPRAMVLDLLLELRTGEDDLLTRREAEVLGMLRRGRSTAAIADRLAIAPVTVRRHISELVRKLGVENRAALAATTDRRWSRPAARSGATRKI